MASVLVGLGVLAGALVSAEPAYALGCDPDQTLPEITGSAQWGTSAQVKRYAGPDGGDEGVYAAVHPAAGEVARYPAGLGMNYGTFGMSWCDATGKGSATIANVAWNWLVVTPLRFAGAVIDFALGGKVVGALLGGAETLVKALHGSFFLEWAPAIIALALCAAMIRMARGRSQQAWGGLVWMVAVIAGLGLLSTSAGFGVVRSVNDTVTGITKSAFLGTVQGTGGGDLSTGVLDALVGTTWGGGALGEAGDDPAPDAFTMTKSSGVPDITRDWTVPVPVAAIPSQTAGQPTMAEVWRWTAAYTEQEASVLHRREEARCAVSGRSPETVDVSNPEFEDLNPEALCSYKWVLRTAMLRHLEENDPITYTVARGATDAALTATGTGIAIVPAMLALAALGLMAVVAEISLIVYIAIAPIVGLVGLARPTIVRRWAEALVSTLITRVATGAALGVVLWALVQVQRLVDGGYAGVNLALPAALRPIAVGILGLALVVVAAKLVKQVGEWMHEAAGVAPAGATAALDRVSGAGKAAVLGAVGLAGGAAGAGAGSRVSGAAAGMLRGANSRGLGGAVTSSATAGRLVAHSKDARARAAGQQALQAQEQALRGHDVEERAGHAEQAVRDTTRDRAQAWRAVVQTPTFAKAAEARQDAAMADVHTADARLQQATAHRDSLVDGRELWVEARTADHVKAGMAPAQAGVRAAHEFKVELATRTEVVDKAQAEFQAANVTLEDALDGVGVDLIEKLKAALDSGSKTADDVVREHGLGPATRDALRAYEDASGAQRAAERAAARLFYDWEG
ncbi:hypothetical protein GXB85_13580 [Cellulomonas sp. APG4]|nr:hypothetical protein [Cellulomonas sp. APG4]